MTDNTQGDENRDVRREPDDPWLETMREGGDPFAPATSSLPPPPGRPPGAAPPSPLPPPPPPPPRGLPHGVTSRPSARPLRLLGRLALVAVAIQSVVALFSAWSHWDRANVLRDFERRLGIGFRQIDQADDRVIVSNLAHLATYVVVGVIFLVWFSAAYRNVAARRRAKHDPNWAIGAWFVPFLAMWRPVKITEELLAERRTLGMLAVMWIWWPLWVASMFIESVLINFSEDVSDLDEFIAADRWQSTARVLHAVAGVFLVILIHTITRGDDEARAAAVETPA
ncbi:MAG: DUF4328 domain-containing protein [Actinomycetota bacterium]